jgi:RND family efflux transporter MFP subunit
MSDNDERYDYRYVEDDAVASPGSSLWGKLLRGLFVLLLVAAAVGISVYWMLNKPRAERRRPEVEARRVEVREVTSGTEALVIHAMGTVVPANEIQLASRVAGELVEVHPSLVPGGRFQAGDLVVRVDPKDYELAVQQREAEVQRAEADVEQRAGDVLQRRSAVTKAESDLAIEMGQQEVAQREYELLGGDEDGASKALVLREPQLLAAKANVAAARAALTSAEGAVQAARSMLASARVALANAKLQLARTEVKAPFNATVRQRHVDLGSQVSVGSTLAALVGTDRYWVQVLVPLSQLQWIRVPGTNSPTGSTVRIYHEAAWGPGGFRTGVVERLMADLEPQGRMARLLVAVDDPLGLTTAPEQRRPMVLDAYVRVEIEGVDLPDVVRIDRIALRDGERVWVMTPEGTLDIREVTIAWSGNEHVCISNGLSSGDRVVVSDLGAAVPGMPLRTGEAPRGGPSKKKPSADGTPGPQQGQEASR